MAFSVASGVARSSVSRPVQAREVTCMAVGARHKGAKKHEKNRPIKYCPADRRHGPPTYLALPAPPPEFVVTAKAEATQK